MGPCACCVTLLWVLVGSVGLLSAVLGVDLHAHYAERLAANHRLVDEARAHLARCRTLPDPLSSIDLVMCEAARSDASIHDRIHSRSFDQARALTWGHFGISVNCGSETYCYQVVLRVVAGMGDWGGPIAFVLSIVLLVTVLACVPVVCGVAWYVGRRHTARVQEETASRKAALITAVRGFTLADKQL